MFDALYLIFLMKTFLNFEDFSCSKHSINSFLTNSINFFLTDSINFFSTNKTIFSSKNGSPRPLFVYFQSFPSNKTNFTENYTRIPCWDSNWQPLITYKYPPLATRPWIPPSNQTVSHIKIVVFFREIVHSEMIDSVKSSLYHFLIG